MNPVNDDMNVPMKVCALAAITCSTIPIRFLSIDAVQKANSGHPGMPMGMADVATVLFRNFLKYNPKNPNWLNRDRFVLSAGHGSMLLYSLLHLTGYKSISLNDIKNFRQLKSICAGHPEYHPGTGIETTTGPLGQGIANSVGFAIAEEILKKKLGKEIINHKTYVLAGDGCLMEGISHEAMSLAGHLKLKNLVMLFDNNSISIDGPTNLAVSDNFKKRFESYGWDYILINGHNEREIFSALKKVQNAKRPTVISCKTKIGYGSPNKSGKASSHGSPIGLDEIKLVRKVLDWKHKPFEIPKSILNEWRKIGDKGEKLEEKWQETINKKFREYLVNFDYLTRMMDNYGFTLLTREECNDIGIVNSVGSFQQLYGIMEEEIKRNPKKKRDYGDAMKMNSKEKQISFYNNYFIYKKIRNVDTRAVYNTMIGSSKLQQQMEQLESIEAKNAIKDDVEPVLKQNAPKKIKRRLKLKAVSK